MSDYPYQPDYRPSNAAGAIGVLLLGVAAGAAIVWLLAPGNQEKILVGTGGSFAPQEWLERATRALREGRDKLIEAVEQDNPDRQA